LRPFVLNNLVFFTRSVLFINPRQGVSNAVLQDDRCSVDDVADPRDQRRTDPGNRCIRLEQEGGPSWIHSRRRALR